MRAEPLRVGLSTILPRGSSARSAEQRSYYTVAVARAGVERGFLGNVFAQTELSDTNTRGVFDICYLDISNFERESIQLRWKTDVMGAESTLWSD